jgi:hypothetical protein
MMWFTDVWSVAGIGVGVGGGGVGVAVGPPAETPPQPESETKKTSKTRGHNIFRISKTPALKDFDGPPEQRVVPNC